MCCNWYAHGALQHRLGSEPCAQGIARDQLTPPSVISRLCHRHRRLGEFSCNQIKIKSSSRHTISTEAAENIDDFFGYYFAL